MSSQTVTVSQYLSQITNTGPYSLSVSLSDTGSNIASLSASDFANLAANGVTTIVTTDHTLGLTVAQYLALGSVSLSGADYITLADTGANLAGLTATQIASLGDAGIRQIDASDNTLSLSLAQFQALGNVTLTAADTVTLTGTGASLTALTTTQISALAGAGIDTIYASDGTLSLTIAQYEALGGVTIAANDVLTLTGTGASISALSVAQFAGLAALGFDKIKATDGTLSLSVGQFNALGTVKLALGDIVTLSDTGSAISSLSASTIASLAGSGVDKISASDGALTLSVAQYTALGVVTLNHANTNVVADSGSAIAALSATQIAALATNGIGTLTVTDHALTLSVAQTEALGSVTITGNDPVTVADTAANLGALSTGDIAMLAQHGVTVVHATDGTVTYSVLQLTTFTADHIAIAPGDTITLTDSTAALAALTTQNIDDFAAMGVTTLHTPGGFTVLSVAQATELVATGITVTSSDLTILHDSPAAIEAMTPAQLAALAGSGFDLIQPGLPMTLDLAQFNALGTVTLSIDAPYTIADTVANLQALTGTDIDALAAGHISVLHATDGAVQVSADVYAHLHADKIAFSGNDSVTLVDSGSAISALDTGALMDLARLGVTAITPTDDTLALSVVQVEALTAQSGALPAVTISGGHVVTLSDSAAAIAGMSEAQISGLAAEGVTQIHSTDTPIQFTLAQFNDLGTVTLASDTHGVIGDAGATLSVLSTDAIHTLSGAGVTELLVTGGELDLTVAQYNEILTDGITLASVDPVADPIKLVDSSAALASLGSNALAHLQDHGITSVVSTAPLVLSLDQYNSFISSGLSTGINFVIADSGETLSLLGSSDYDTMHTNGVISFDVTSGHLGITLAQFNAMTADNIALTVEHAAGATATLSVAATDFAGLNLAQIGVIGGAGFDTIDVTDTSSPVAVTINAASAALLQGVHFAAEDVVTLSDTGSAIAALSATQIAALATEGVTQLAVTDSALTLTYAQFQALGTVSLDHSAVNTLSIATVDFATLDATALNALNVAGITQISGIGGTLTITMPQLVSLGAITLDAASYVTLADTGAHLVTLDPVALADHNIDAIAATDGTLTAGVSFLEAVSGASIGIDHGTVVTLSDTTAALTGLSNAQIQSLVQTTGIAHVVSDAPLTLTLDQFESYETNGTVTFDSADSLTVMTDAIQLEMFGLTDLASLVQMGVQHITLTNPDNAITLDALGFEALGSIDFTNHAAITLQGAIALLSVDQISALAGKGVVDVYGSGPLSIAQLQAFGTVTLDASSSFVAADTAATINALTVDQINALAAQGVKSVEVIGGGSATLSLAQATAFEALPDHFLLHNNTLADTGATLATLDTQGIAALAQLGITSISATDTGVAFDATQALALASNGIHVAGDTIGAVFDTAADITALTPAQIAQLASDGFLGLAATDASLTLTAAQSAALGSMEVASTGTVTLSDLTSAISALSAGDIAGLAGAGITSIYATNGTLKLSAAQYEALGTTTIDSRDKVTISSNHSFVADNAVNNVTLVGNRNIDATGNSKANILIANSGNDHLNGMGGDDKLVTGTGHDTLTGGLGADRFVFADGKTGGNSFATADRITDFNHSEHDVIVLTGVSAIAGNSASAGEFTFIGDHSFSGHAGELRYEQVGGNTYIEGDTTGSGSAGFMIRVDGLHDFVASDFALNPLLL